MNFALNRTDSSGYFIFTAPQNQFRTYFKGMQMSQTQVYNPKMIHIFVLTIINAHKNADKNICLI